MITQNPVETNPSKPYIAALQRQGLMRLGRRMRWPFQLMSIYCALVSAPSLADPIGPLLTDVTDLTFQLPLAPILTPVVVKDYGAGKTIVYALIAESNFNGASWVLTSSFTLFPGTGFTASSAMAMYYFQGTSLMAHAIRVGGGGKVPVGLHIVVEYSTP
jgi:hypothetical protein